MRLALAESGRPGEVAAGVASPRNRSAGWRTSKPHRSNEERHVGSTMAVQPDWLKVEGRGGKRSHLWTGAVAGPGNDSIKRGLSERDRLAQRDQQLDAVVVGFLDRAGDLTPEVASPDFGLELPRFRDLEFHGGTLRKVHLRKVLRSCR
ncbi:MAG: hypothetical protein ACRDL5_11675 [Solirubrobacteraceae bacterium]